jgi:hypothetical protein
MTHAFERYALELSKFTTIQDAAQHLDVSWDRSSRGAACILRAAAYLFETKI